jgi:hypothetical protein
MTTTFLHPNRLCHYGNREESQGRSHNKRSTILIHPAHLVHRAHKGGHKDWPRPIEVSPQRWNYNGVLAHSSGSCDSTESITTILNYEARASSVEHGADASAKRKDEWTPLHQASSRGGVSCGSSSSTAPTCKPRTRMSRLRCMRRCLVVVLISRDGSSSSHELSRDNVTRDVDVVALSRCATAVSLFMPSDGHAI